MRRFSSLCANFPSTRWDDDPLAQPHHPTAVEQLWRCASRHAWPAFELAWTYFGYADDDKMTAEGQGDMAGFVSIDDSR